MSATCAKNWNAIPNSRNASSAFPTMATCCGCLACPRFPTAATPEGCLVGGQPAFGDLIEQGQDRKNDHGKGGRHTVQAHRIDQAVGLRDQNLGLAEWAAGGDEVDDVEVVERPHGAE